MILKAYLRKPDQSGLARLSFVYKNIWIESGLKVKPDSWDQKKQYIKASMPGNDKLNLQLGNRRGRLMEVLDFLKYNDIAATKEIIEKELEKKKVRAQKENGLIEGPKSPTISSLLLKYKEENKLLLKNSYLRKFKTIADHHVNFVKKFNKGETAATFNKDVLQEYLTYLIEEHELESNTLFDHVRKIRLVMELAAARREEVNPDYLQFKFKYVTPKPIWLDPESELKLLEAFEPLEEDQVYLEEFLFRCYTGFRWSDVQQLRPHHFIKKGSDLYVDVTLIKTKLDQNILLSSKAAKIAKKWGLTAPRLYLCDCNERIKKPIARGAKLFNMTEKVRFRGSERIVSVQPKWELVTTHVARRTFGRMWMEKGGDILKLSRYYGHSSIEQTMQYIGWTTTEVNEELKKVMG